MAKRAVITGITGQDGSYLAELLLAAEPVARYELFTEYCKSTSCS